MLKNEVYTDDIGRSFSNRRPEERAGLLRQQPRSAATSAKEEELLELKQDLEEGIACMLQKNSTTLDANLAFHEQELERVERELRELRKKKKSKTNGKKTSSKTIDSQESKSGTLLSSSNSSPSQSLWLLGLFLFFAAYVNTNDPDAFFWTPCYGFAGILSWLCLVKPVVVRTTLRNLYKTYFVMSLAVAAGSFSLLRSEANHHNVGVSGKSGWLGVFELEPVREGGGALIMAWAMYLCLPSWEPQESSSSSSTSANATLSLIITSASGIVAALAIYLGVILPQYYTRLGVAIPEHCGGSGEEPESNLLMQS